mmetsp:Transcript_42490/g.51567  ORF Transcript_42490/g.51567 Transcript_42490/m.51567 type:complete len:1158 (+) Transcript_42490:252-3725(+)
MASPNNPPVSLDRLHITQTIPVMTSAQYEDMRTLLDWLTKGSREHTVRLNALSENALRGRKVEEDLARMTLENDSMKLSFEAIEERTTAIETRTEVAETSIKGKLNVDSGDAEARRKIEALQTGMKQLKNVEESLKEYKENSTAFASNSRLELAKLQENLKECKKRVETIEGGPAGQLLVMGVDVDSLVDLPRLVQEMREEMTNKLASIMNLPDAPLIEVPAAGEDGPKNHKLERAMSILGVQQQTLEEKHVRQADKLKELTAQLRELKTGHVKITGQLEKFGEVPSGDGSSSGDQSGAYKMAEEAIRIAEKSQSAVDSLLEHVEVLQASKKRLEKTMESRLTTMEEELAKKADVDEMQNLLKNRSHDLASAVKGAVKNVKMEKSEAGLAHMTDIVEAMHERLETAEGQLDYLDAHLKEVMREPKIDEKATKKLIGEATKEMEQKLSQLGPTSSMPDDSELKERFNALDEKVTRAEEGTASVRNLIEEHAGALQELSEHHHQFVKRDEHHTVHQTLIATLDEKADKEMVNNMLKLATPTAATPSSPGGNNDARWAQFMKILQDIQNAVGKKAERGEVSSLRSMMDSTKAELSSVKTIAKAAVENPKLPETIDQVKAIQDKLDSVQPIIETLQNRAAHWLTSADLKPLALIQDKLETKADRADLDSMIEALSASRGANAASGEIGVAQVQALQEAVAVHSEQLKRKAGSGDVTQLRHAVEELKNTLEEAATKAANSTQEVRTLKKRLDEAARRESSTRSQAAGAIDAQKQQLRRLQQMIATSVSELRNDVDSKLPRADLSAGETRILNKVQELLTPIREAIDSTQSAHTSHKAEHAKVASTASGAAASAKAANLAADEQYRRMEAHEARLQELCDLLIRCGEGVLLLAAGGGGLEMPGSPTKGGAVADASNVQVTSAKKGANWRPLPPRALIGKFDQIMRVPGSFNQKANMNQIMSLQAELQRAASRILALEEQYEGLEPDLGKKADKAELRKLAKMIDVNRKTVVTDTAMLYSRGSNNTLRCMSCNGNIDHFPSNMVPSVPTNSMPKPNKLASLTESTNFGGGGMSSAGLNRIAVQKHQEAHAAAQAAGLSRPPMFASPSPGAQPNGVVGGPFWEREGRRSQSPNSQLPPLDDQLSHEYNDQYSPPPDDHHPDQIQQ